jgi:hypothetical protein
VQSAEFSLRAFLFLGSLYLFSPKREQPAILFPSPPRSGGEGRGEVVLGFGGRSFALLNAFIEIEF